MSNVDSYLQDVIKKGDQGSELLEKICAPTLRNSMHVDRITEGINGINVIRPEEHLIVVHSAGGDPEKRDLAEYAESAVERLVEQAGMIGAEPAAFADVIDSRTGDSAVLEAIANAFARIAGKYGLAIVNGENAILGERISYDANVSVTMISLLKKEKWKDELPMAKALRKQQCFAVFDPKCMAVYMNSDGVGTKTEFYERAERYEPAVSDFMAMNLDDLAKIGAAARVISGVVEIRGDIPFKDIDTEARRLAGIHDCICIMATEHVGERIRGYADEAPSYNISGSAVSVIDEERLKNPLRPSAGESLIAIAGKPNPRSNGITDKRKTMIRLFGNNWHSSEDGRRFLQYLAAPSTILYLVFEELIEEGLATSVYHMSGGAYNGKLAKPLAKHGMHVRIDDLFPPHWVELALAGADFTSAEAAYAKWPMGNDGFITTKEPKEAIKVIREWGVKAREVGILENAADGRAGVELKACNGENVYFSGKE
jgi:phosphoribosylaminoimidazole (AIR) synthetase